MYVIRIETDNAAFEGGRGTEIARILRKLADRVDGTDARDRVRLMDVNGNAVGAAGGA